LQSGHAVRLIWAAVLSIFLGNDLHPISVGILDEVNAHRRVFITHATHLLVMREGGGVVVGYQSQMKLIIPKIVGFRTVSKPGQFKFVRSSCVTQKNEYEAFVGRLNSPGLDKIQRIAIEIQTLLEIPNVNAVVIKSKYHAAFSIPERKS
jgi:hypothetical protein